MGLPLHRAAWNNDPEGLAIAISKIEAGEIAGGIDAIDPMGNTALHLAAVRGSACNNNISPSVILKPQFWMTGCRQYWVHEDSSRQRRQPKCKGSLSLIEEKTKQQSHAHPREWTATHLSSMPLAALSDHLRSQRCSSREELAWRTPVIPSNLTQGVEQTIISIPSLTDRIAV